MVLNFDLTGSPQYLWLWGAIITALGGVCVRLIVSVRRLSSNEKARLATEKVQKERDQAIWDAWKTGADGQRQQLQNLANQVQSLQLQNTELFGRVIALHQELAAVTSENGVMKSQVIDLQRHNTELQGQLSDFIRGHHAVG